MNRIVTLALLFAACCGDARTPEDGATAHEITDTSTQHRQTPAADSVVLVPRPITDGPALGDTGDISRKSSTTSRAVQPRPSKSVSPPQVIASGAAIDTIADDAPVSMPADATRTDTTTTVPVVSAPAAPKPDPVHPFSVGEKLDYEVRFGPLRVGKASMELRGIEEVRGQRAYHAVFRVQGGNVLYKVNDHYESWFSLSSLSSLRYMQNIDQGSYERMRRYEIFPERRVFREEGKSTDEPSVAEPLDDASFLYFLRTVPLEVGRTYTFERYFRPDRNPVTVRVIRRERVRVPAGEFDAVVVQPIIKTPGIFSEGGRAEVWFADDSTRRILQIRSKLKFGSLSLYLR